MNPNIKFNFHDSFATYIMSYNNEVFGHYTLMASPIVIGKSHLYFYLHIYEGDLVAFAQSAEQCEFMLSSAALRRFIE